VKQGNAFYIANDMMSTGLSGLPYPTSKDRVEATPPRVATGFGGWYGPSLPSDFLEALDDDLATPCA
jgi:hypothetical protein